MNSPKNSRLFIVKYIPQTNARPARIKITDHRFMKQITIPRGDNQDMVDDAAQYLNGLGFNDLTQAEGKDNAYLITGNFQIQIK